MKSVNKENLLKVKKKPFYLIFTYMEMFDQCMFFWETSSENLYTLKILTCLIYKNVFLRAVLENIQMFLREPK